MELLSERECDMIITFAESSMKLSAVCRKMDTDSAVISRRFDRIKERTGLDARNFYDLVSLVEMARRQP